MRLLCRAAALVLSIQGALLAELAAAQNCRAKLIQAAPAAAGGQQWVDVATPDSACSKTLPGFEGTYQLVFSDEFNTNDRDFKSAAQDQVWTAEDMYYFPTRDEEVYKPEQIKVEGGAAVITLEEGKAVAPSQQPDGAVWEVGKAYKSGFMSSWNKLCFTGGYLEAAVQMPGNDVTSGFWPAFWTMGNLGRAGHMRSTAGMWPYSYNTCDGSGKQAWSKLEGQLITACSEDPPGVNRSRWDMKAMQGRGAPEFDVFEVSSTPGGQEPPHASQTLQMGPIMPVGTYWWDGPAAGGVQYPGAGTAYRTRRNSWSGSLGRPGNEYQDSISALSDLGPSYYTGYHTFGVDWRPGQYLRWYIDGQLLYEVNQQALVAQRNGTGAAVGPRLIPVEAMYIIFNLGMSGDFGKIEYDKLPFPSQMKIDWVRVYQRPDSINVGCSPPDYPTAQYLACNRGKYIIRSEDNVLIKDACKSSALGAAAGAAVRAQLLLASMLVAALLLLL